MILLGDKNIYIDICEKLYDAIIISDNYPKILSDYNIFDNKVSFNNLYESIFSTEIKRPKNIIEYIKIMNDSNFSYKFGRKDIFKTSDSITLYKEIYNINTTIENLSSDILNVNSLSFMTLWQICDLVKWAEQSIFYKNDINKKLYVDSNINSDEKQFKILNDDYNILFNLTMTKKPDKNSSYTESAYFKNIQIKVRRAYGRQLEDTFMIVDADVKYNNSADLYLMNTINKLLKINVLNTFNDIILFMYKNADDLNN